MIRAIAFDAYGTLFDVYSIARLADELFPGKGEAVAGLWRDKQVEYTRLRTLCGHYADFWQVTEDALTYTCERLNLPLAAEAMDRLMDQYARLESHPENKAALSRLKKEGIPMAILSNGTHAMLTSAVAAAGMDGLFDHILSVDGVRRYKTAPEAYQLGPDALGLPAREILFVSSNGWDACGATWFGYPTFWINRHGLPPERLGVQPTMTGRTMDDVVAFVLSQ
jgi:2-haloacid dehalogenase